VCRGVARGSIVIKF
jgi:UBX domain-containing protein 1